MVPLPLWADAKRVEDLCGIAPPQLARLVEAGHVRSRKLGQEKQAKRIYRLLDVIEFLEGSEAFPAARTAETSTSVPVGADLPG
jgi:hypothetical protein